LRIFKKNGNKNFLNYKICVYYNMPPSMPVYYSVSGSSPQPLPSTGMFSSLGKQSTATSRDDAVAKAKASNLNIPGKQIWGADQKPFGYVVEYQNGGKRRKTRRGLGKSMSGRKTRRNKSRKSRSWFPF
jgi:hypothetical protein